MHSPFAAEGLTVQFDKLLLAADALLEELIRETSIPNIVYSEGPKFKTGTTAIEKCFYDYTQAFEDLFVDRETACILEWKLEWLAQGGFQKVEYLGFQQYSANNEEITNINLRIKEVCLTYQIHSNKICVFAKHSDLVQKKKAQIESQRKPENKDKPVDFLEEVMKEAQHVLEETKDLFLLKVKNIVKGVNG